MQTRIENGMSINVYTPKITKAMVLVIRSKPRFQLMLPVNGWREIAELNEFKYTDEIDCWVMHKKGDENGNLSLLIQKNPDENLVQNVENQRIDGGEERMEAGDVSKTEENPDVNYF
ncbi:hypothetical protein LWI28_018526 [Acer negundo]|uniref:Uncharacterized protein n=1 Tax=Acer negundo TaxID=4023 RepID=A0AAD5NYF1_ACENE|nr:hypothetical protein LWI28_018526 [Acer negundo]